MANYLGNLRVLGSTKNGPKNRIEFGIREPIPSLISQLFQSWVSMKVISVSPDRCLAEFFKEGDNQPQRFPRSFGRPMGMMGMFVSDIKIYRGSISISSSNHGLSLSPGSVVIVEGGFAFSVHAIRRQQILLSFFTGSPSASASTGSPSASASTGSPPPKPVSKKANFIKPVLRFRDPELDRIENETRAKEEEEN